MLIICNCLSIQGWKGDSGPPGFRGPVSVMKDNINVMLDQVFPNIKEILNQCPLLTANDRDYNIYLFINSGQKKIAIVIICPFDNGQIFLSGPTWSLECTGNAHPGLQRRKSLCSNRPGLSHPAPLRSIGRQQ